MGRIKRDELPPVLLKKPVKRVAEPRKANGYVRRECRVCKKDPWPNYFFCARCHPQITDPNLNL